MKYKIIRSMTDANVLLDMGNKVLKIDRDKFNRKYLIFLFEETEKFIKDLEKITNK